MLKLVLWYNGQYVAYQNREKEDRTLDGKERNAPEERQ
jgi:hypothetical protein